MHKESERNYCMNLNMTLSDDGKELQFVVSRASFSCPIIVMLAPLPDHGVGSKSITIWKQ